MKSVLALLLAAACLFSLAACGRDVPASEPTQTRLSETSQETQEETAAETDESLTEEEPEYPEETVWQEEVEYPEETVPEEIIEYPEETVHDSYYEEIPETNTGTGGQETLTSDVAEPLTWSKLNSIPIASSAMTEDALRKICVDFMRLQISFAWTPSENMTYTTGGQSVTLYKGSVYGGLPYVSSTFGNIYKVMEYYDEANGVLKVQPNIAKIIGNQCSASAYWAWSRVSNAISFGGTQTMLETNGCLRIGSYTYDSSIRNFHSEGISTANICRDNGQQTMYEAYAFLKPADGLSMYTGTAGHVRMVAAKANVVRNSDGSINGDRSTVTYLDQVSNWKSKTQSNGEPISIQGGVDVTVSFASLYKAGYLPFRIPELAGSDPVEKAAVAFSHSGASVSLDVLYNATVSANYPLSDITVTVKDKNGTQVYRNTVALTTLNIRQSGMSNAVRKTELAAYAGGTYTVEISCRVGTGEKLVAYSGTLTG